MAFPIRVKLVRKDTGETFKQWAIRTGASSPYRLAGKYQLMPFLNEEGNIGFVDAEDFYLDQSFLSPADWKLLVATEKNDKGEWDFKQVGH